MKTLIAVFALFVLCLPAQAHNGQFRQNFRQNFNRGYQQNFRQNFSYGYQQNFRQRFVQPYCSQPVQIVQPYCEPAQIIVAPQQVQYSAPVQYQYTQPVQRLESGCGCNGTGQLQRYRVRGY